MLGGEEEVRFALVTLLGFVLIASDPRVFVRPLPVDEAVGLVREWLDLPNVSMAGPTQEHWQVFGGLARDGQARGAMVMDAHLAALAREHGAPLCTTDRDFARFPGLRVRDPLA